MSIFENHVIRNVLKILFVRIMLLEVKTVKRLSNKKEVSIFHTIYAEENGSSFIHFSFVRFSLFVISYERCYI